MKFNNYTFPYPVLGLDNNILSNCDLKCEIKSNQNESFYRINVEFITDNTELLELVSIGKAVFISETTCSATLFRKVDISELPITTFKIPKHSVRGKVEITFMLLAKDDIPDYSNSKMHPDFFNYKFPIESGDILGIFKHLTFNADINYHKLKAVSAFMEIESENIEFMNIILDNPKITVQLPVEDYQLFNKDIICKNSDFSPIVHSSIVYNALLFSLFNISGNDQLWAQVIRQRMNEKEFKHLSLEDKSNLPEITQRLLGKPVERLITGLDYLVKNKNYYE